MGRLEGRVALVTGAASGIGAATVARFSSEGARVAGADLAEEPAGSSAATWRRLDVRDEIAVEEAVVAVVAQHGRLDVVVNAAGVGGGGPVHLLDAAEWQRVIDVNLTGTFLVCKHATARMLAQDPVDGERGSIVNLASVEGIEGTEGGSTYNASKGGVVLLTRNMAIDYGRRGIRVNCICPGFIDTPLTMSIFGQPGMAEVLARFVEGHQLGRIGRPDEIASAALFLASSDSSFVSGHALVVDGGYTAGHRHGLAEVLGLG